MTYNPPTDRIDLAERLEAIVATLYAPSFQQDSQWHTARATYATKPRDLLTEAASTIRSLSKALEEAREGLRIAARDLDLAAGTHECASCESNFERARSTLSNIEKTLKEQSGE